MNKKKKDYTCNLVYTPPSQKMPLPTPAKQSCSTCKFYVRHEYENIEEQATFGHCRRYPPKRYDQTNSVFPVVLDDSWCGEHRS